MTLPPPDLYEELKNTPVVKLNFGTASMRRRMQKAGISCILDIIELSERELDSMLEFNDVDKILSLKKKFEKNFTHTAKTLLASIESARKTVDAILAKASEEKTPFITPEKTSRRSTPIRRTFTHVNNGVLPALPCAKTLKAFEPQIADLFADLKDRYDNPLIYQLFSHLSAEIDTIDRAFIELFNAYQTQPQRALDMAETRLPNSFLVFVANRARIDYDGGNLWGNMFDIIEIDDTNVQSNFKRAFVEIIEKKDLPLFARDEEANFYFYTALLHGGLSYDSWEDLWSSSLVPLAKCILKNQGPFDRSADGRQILYELRNTDGRFLPKTSVRKILDRAPSRVTAPLLEAGLEVAIQIETSKRIDRDEAAATLISSSELPEAALRALSSAEERLSDKSNYGSDTETSGKRVRGIVYLPHANLQLDLDAGEVYACWERQQFPAHFVDYAVEYRIDGKLVKSMGFIPSVGKCLLEKTKIPLPPSTRYEIELALIAIDEHTEKRTTIGSLAQSFARNKPACFEFIRQSNGIYRLREKNERLSKERTIAYIVKSGYSIKPKCGMTPIGRYESRGSWGGEQVFVFSVSPSASGSIVDSRTGVEYAVWQERYIATIDKTHILGKTSDGVDLYGFRPSSTGINGGLPTISVEAFDGRNAINDLNITCIADERRIAIPRKALWDETESDNIAKIAFDLSEAYGIDRHIENCAIEIKQHSIGDGAVLRYRFAVIPIQEFKLASVDLSYGIAVAEYSFQLKCDAEIFDSQHKAELIKVGNYWTAKTLLKDEFLRIGIKTGGQEKTTDALLALAAIDFEIPDVLISKSNTHPINLCDALELGANSGVIRISSYGRRRRRAVYASIGCKPFLFQEFKRAESHEFNVFSDRTWLVPDNDETPAVEPLMLAIHYGDDLSSGSLKEATAEIALLEFQKGYGFSSQRILCNRAGKHFIRFDSPIDCEALVTFRVDKSGRVVGKSNVTRGSDSVEIPDEAFKLIDRKRKMRFEIAPKSLFGDPLQEYAVEYKLKG